MSSAEENRMSVRPQHLADAKIGHENGWIGSSIDSFLDFAVNSLM